MTAPRQPHDAVGRPARSLLGDEVSRLFGFDPWSAWSDSTTAPMTWARQDDALVLREDLHLVDERIVARKPQV